MTSPKRTTKLVSGGCLLVDDDRGWLRFIEMLVNSPALRTCSDSRLALTMLRETKSDLLITDTNMPHVSGIELLQRVRQEPDFNALPVIVLFSGLANSKITAADVLSMGATMVLTKGEFIEQYQNLLSWLFRPER